MRAGGPAETTIVVMVHSAIRRDLVRSRIVVVDAEVDVARRTALGEHLQWLVRKIRDYHDAQERTLLPLLVARRPSAAELAAVMTAEQAAIVPAAERLDLAARDYRDGADGAREDLLQALTNLDTVLLPHLERKETELLPVISGALTQEEWSEWDRSANVRPKTTSQVAMEGLWLLDGADDACRSALLAEISAVPRILVLGAFGGRYRRLRRLLWAESSAAEVPSLTLPRYSAWG